MGGNLVAVGLLLTFGVSLYVVLRYPQRSVNRRLSRVMFGLAACSIAASFLIPLGAHEMGGLSVQIMVITTISLIAVSIIPKPPRRLYLGTLVFDLVMIIGLTYYGYLLATGKEYTGLRHPYQHIQSSTVYSLEARADADTRHYPAGWLRNMPFADEFPDRAFTGYRIIPHPFWHSRLTGLYRRETIHGEVWYPGGFIKDAMMFVEIRPRK